jgi:hypothetical protein
MLTASRTRRLVRLAIGLAGCVSVFCGLVWFGYAQPKQTSVYEAPAPRDLMRWHDDVTGLICFTRAERSSSVNCYPPKLEPTP